jgi:hypothetical protein
MGRINIFSDFSNLKGVTELGRFLSAFTQKLVQEINGRLELVENVRASGPHSVYFPNNTTIVGVTHTLGKVPVGWLEVNRSDFFTLSHPTTPQYAWTEKQVFLLCQAAGGGSATIYLI